MQLSPKFIGLCSVPPAGAAVVGGVLLNGGGSSEIPDSNSINKPEPVTEPLKATVQEPAKPTVPVRSNPIPRITSRPSPARTVVRHLSTSPQPQVPTYNISVFSDPKTTTGQENNYVLKHTSAQYLLNADPAFNQDKTFKDKWTKKLNYLNSMSSNNLVKESVFSEALNGTIDKLSNICRDAYTGSVGIKPVNATKKYWQYPNSARSWFSDSNKLAQRFGIYWDAVWKFCSYFDSGSTQLNRSPGDWGTTK